MKLSKLFKAASLVAVIALLASCATPEKKPTSVRGKETSSTRVPLAKLKEKIPSLNRMLANAEVAVKEKDTRRELAIHGLIVEYYPNDKRSVIAYYRLGQYYLNLRNYALALKHFEPITSKFQDTQYYRDSLIGRGISLVYLKKEVEANTTLNAALAISETRNNRSSIIYHQAENLYLSNRHMKALEKFLECMEIPGSFRNQAERRIRAILHNFLAEWELLGIADIYRGRFPADLALVELSQIYRRNADEANFTAIRERLENEFSGITIPEYSDVLDGRESLPAERGPTDVITIGAVLPLSGDDSEIGLQALKGIQLAFSLNSGLVEEKGVRLVIKDSASDPSVARSAIKELGETTSVIGVIGPFTDLTLNASLDIPHQYGLPLITPAKSRYTYGQGEGLTQLVFQTGITGESQGKMLAELIVDKLRLYKIAVLYPDDDYGNELMLSFVTTADMLGGDIKAMESYQPDATDFGDQIKKMGGMVDSQLRDIIFDLVLQEEESTPVDINELLEIIYQTELAVPYITKFKELPLTHDNFSCALKINYDVLFIPANYDKAGLILPELAFYNISEAIVVGADRYASPELIRIGGKYTEGTVFTGEFFADSNRPEVKTFVASFENAFASRPDVNSARGYDSVNMLLSLIQGGVGDRRQLVDSMNSFGKFSGVSGELVKNPEEGTFTKFPYLLTVKGGKIVEYVPAEDPLPPEPQE